jgi:hypothetical protein
VYAGENDLLTNITVVDSGGVVNTTYGHTGAFASKVQAEWNGDGIDFDDDGNFEVFVSFQGSADSIYTTTYTHDGSNWDTTVTAVANDRNWAGLLLEYSEGTVGVDPITFVTPNDYKLFSNYPNPFNPSTMIEYQLPLDKNVTVKVYNLMGQSIRTLVSNEFKNAGRHAVQWNGLNDAGRKVASGVYIYSLEWGNFKKTNRMMLLK